MSASPRRSSELPFVTSVRGRGLLLGAELAPEVSAIELARRALLEERLVINATGPSSLRMEPPLIVTEARSTRPWPVWAGWFRERPRRLVSSDPPLERMRAALRGEYSAISARRRRLEVRDDLDKFVCRISVLVARRRQLLARQSSR